jgi:diaminopimelate decarboxylase
MKELHYVKGEASLDGISLKRIAEQFGTPCYVYSRATLEANYREFDQAFQEPPVRGLSHQICYAVKANSNLTLLNVLSQLGAGFDLVSGGELERVLKAGGDPQKVIFSGVGKQAAEIETALRANIYCFNVESEAELERIQEVAQELGKVAPIALRVNPDIDAMTHPYIATGLKDNKFGIARASLAGLRPKIKKMKNLKLIGLACHIGSQLVKLEPFREAMGCLRELSLEFAADRLPLQHLNVGGGLGVRYRNENPPSRKEYVALIKEMFSGQKIKIILEPGRSLMADAGLLLTRVEYLKETADKNFAILDAAMNDLLRPALYEAWHDIIPVTAGSAEVKSYDLVGPVCESADCLARDRRLRLKANDLLAILTTGAYGFSMSSNYNTRPRPAEVLIDGNKVHVIRRRETVKDLYALEKIPGKTARKSTRKASGSRSKKTTKALA